MLKRLFTALVCGVAITGQMRAQEVVVARQEIPNFSPPVASATRGRDSESETATETKSASTTLTVEQMRMAGALAAKRQKEQTLAEQMRALKGSSYNQGPERDALQVVTKEKTAKNTQTIAHYSYKTPEGKKESVAVITQYYPKQIVYRLPRSIGASMAS